MLLVSNDMVTSSLSTFLFSLPLAPLLSSLLFYHLSLRRTAERPGGGRVEAAPDQGPDLQEGQLHASAGGPDRLLAARRALDACDGMPKEPCITAKRALSEMSPAFPEKGPVTLVIAFVEMSPVFSEKRPAHT